MQAAGWMLSAALVPGAAAQVPADDRDGAPQGQVDVSEAPRALASNGAIVVMPGIGGLDCRGMSEVLALIDRSGYRGPTPLPADHPDREIFEYEHRLAAAHFYKCLHSRHGLDDPGPAFSEGFETP